MKHTPILAGLTLATALVLSSCSTQTGATSVAAAAASAATTSLSSGGIAELSYPELGIAETDVAVDVAAAVQVTLADGASAGGAGVSVDGDTVTITAAGTYRVSGTLTAGSLVVDAPDGAVTLLLDGVDITAASVAASHVVDADRVVVWLADGSTNVLADAAGAAADETVEDSPNATLFSTGDLWIGGDGALSVTAHAADGITSKDTLVLTGGDITVDAADDGVRGKDHLVVTGGSLAVDAGGDALRSDNASIADEPDAAVGVIWIDGAFTVSGGTLAANGMATMAVGPGEGSTQATLALTFGGTVPAGTLITITDAAGEQVAALTTSKASQSLIVSSGSLAAGADYAISVGGEVTGTPVGWLVLDGLSSGASTIGTVAAG